MMKIKFLAISAAMLLGMSNAALAWHGGHGHGGFGVYMGVPLYSPWYYPPAYYYPPVPIYSPAVIASPPVYVEQGDSDQSTPAPQSQQSWYYCNASRAYYPYVKECPGGWQRVEPQPG
jgi:hypothetical protein